MTEPDANNVMNKDWAKIACKLRQDNRFLSKKVVHLEQALADSQEKLRSSVGVLNADPLSSSSENVSQELILSLIQEIAASHECVEHQQMLIDLSQKLEASQERVAQLERECALRQEEYNEQTHQLMAAQAQVQALVHLRPVDKCESDSVKRVIAEPSTSAPATPTQILPWSERVVEEKLGNRIAVGIAQTLEELTAATVTENSISSTSPASYAPREKVVSPAQTDTSSLPSYRLQTTKPRKPTTIQLPEFLQSRS